MSHALSAVPRAKRKQLAAVFALFAALFVAVGAVALAGGGGAGVVVFAVLSLLLGVLLGLAAGGVLHGLREESRQEQAARVDASIDAAINEALAKHGYGSMCSCGHEHDPSELHVTDAEPCAHDGRGGDCAHTCETCVLAAMRPASPRPSGP